MNLKERVDMRDDIEKIIVQIIELRKKYKIRQLDRNNYGVAEFLRDLSSAQESLVEAKKDALRMVSNEEEIPPSGLSDVFKKRLLRSMKK